MKRLLLLLLVAPAAFSASTVTLSVHLLVACSKEASVKVKLDGPPQCLDPKPFLTQADVQSAELQKNSQGHAVILLTFHNDAAIRELQITRKNIGNPVAIVVNGRVVSVPRIAAASRLLYVDGDFKPEQASALVAAFNKQTNGH